MELYSERYILQSFFPHDQQFVFEGLSHPEVIRYYGVQFYSYEAASLQMEWFTTILKEETGQWWKIVNRQTGEKLGAIGMNNYQPQHRCTEIGYWLLPKYWRQGIVREVLPQVLAFLFDVKKMHRVAATVEEGNDSSCRVLEHAGFQREGVQRDCEYKNGNFISLIWYSLLEQEWRKGA